MVATAFHKAYQMPYELFVFSDDMDGLRKVPSNLPAQQMLEQHLGCPLSSIPDPFGTHKSFAAHNNNKLCQFLDSFGFSYKLKSATDLYKGGVYNPTLKKVLAHHNEIAKIVAADLGEERRKNYSPFLPIHQGKVLQAKVVETDTTNNTIVFIHPHTNKQIRTSILDGKAKLQWKVDWAMRWAHFGVGYEMAGKDLIDSVRVSSKIARVLGAKPPQNFIYELFLDEKGEKISKSSGNGITIEKWLRYAPKESLAYFLYHHPKRAKRLYFDVIPKATDGYIAALKEWWQQSKTEQATNPITHLCFEPRKIEGETPTFSMLLNLATAAGGRDEKFLWGFIQNGYPKLKKGKFEVFDELVKFAVAYFSDFIKPVLNPRDANAMEKSALLELAENLERLKPNTPAEDIQAIVYEVGKAHKFEPLRGWFSTLYEVLLGSSQGARFGSFVALYGIKETIQLIRQRCQNA